MKKNSGVSCLKKGNKIFFTGIGGYSMSGLAEICLEKGFTVAGSDLEHSHRTEHLEAIGIKVYYGHDVDNIKEFAPDCLVYSAAVPKNNPELIQARSQGSSVMERSYFLGEVNRRYKRVINIAGTHGKTTTTTLASLMLEEAGLDPTAHIGAMVSSWDSTVRIGKTNDIFVSEACEYNSSFLRFYSTTAAILNIDHDHLDCFPNIEDVIDAFVLFANTLSDKGTLLIPAQAPHMDQFLKQLRKLRKDLGLDMPRLVTFGLEDDLFEGKAPDFQIKNFTLLEGLPNFDCYIDGKFAVAFEMQIPGEYNALNALAALACAVLHGADPASCARVVENFHGADNRFNYLGNFLGARVFSDYAHHPSALELAYRAAKNLTEGKVWAIFQPITYHRVIGLFHDFTKALLPCDVSILFEVYSSRESDNRGFSSRMICDEINKMGGSSLFCQSFEELVHYLESRVSKDDLILFMGPERMQDYAGSLAQEQTEK